MIACGLQRFERILRAMDCTHVSAFGAPMPFGCTAPAGAPAGAFPGALPAAAVPSAGDVVETVGGVAGIVMEVAGPFIQLLLNDGSTRQVSTSSVTVKEKANGNGNGNGLFGGDMLPVLVGGGALVLVLVLLMGRR